jgi:hypothetical protein
MELPQELEATLNGPGSGNMDTLFNATGALPILLSDNGWLATEPTVTGEEKVNVGNAV